MAHFVELIVFPAPTIWVQLEYYSMASEIKARLERAIGLVSRGPAASGIDPENFVKHRDSGA
jgi:hypothetical protein